MLTNREDNMKPTAYNKGIFFSAWNIRHQQFGIGLVWDREKYLHINLFNFEVAIGKCIN